MKETCRVCGRPKGPTPEEGECRAHDVMALDWIRSDCWRLGYERVTRERDDLVSALAGCVWALRCAFGGSDPRPTPEEEDGILQYAERVLPEGDGRFCGRLAVEEAEQLRTKLAAIAKAVEVTVEDDVLDHVRGTVRRADEGKLRGMALAELAGLFKIPLSVDDTELVKRIRAHVKRGARKLAYEVRDTNAYIRLLHDMQEERDEARRLAGSLASARPSLDVPLAKDDPHE